MPGCSAAQLAAVGIHRAVAMASSSPARVLGERDLGRIRPGALADLVILDSGLQVRMTMVGGRVVYDR